MNAAEKKYRAGNTIISGKKYAVSASQPARHTSQLNGFRLSTGYRTCHWYSLMAAKLPVMPKIISCMTQF
jgi:hypothetical protein